MKVVQKKRVTEDVLSPLPRERNGQGRNERSMKDKFVKFVNFVI